MEQQTITIQESAEALRLWLEPIEQILLDHGWTRVAEFPNIWLKDGKTSFLAEALREMLAERDDIQRTLSEIESEVSKTYHELTFGTFTKANTESVHILERVRELQDQDHADLEEALATLEEANTVLNEKVALLKTELHRQHDFAKYAFKNGSIEFPPEIAAILQEGSAGALPSPGVDTPDGVEGRI